MMKPLNYAIAVAVACAVPTVGPVQAEPMVKQVYRKPTPIRRGDYADPFYGRQGGRICARWCINDRNPCDPPDFKVADGRCNWENW